MCAEGLVHSERGDGFTGHLLAVPQILTPLCGGPRGLAEGPVLGVSPFSRGLMGSVVCVWRFLCRRTKAGLSAPLVSPSSSLKSPVAATRNPEGAKTIKAGGTEPEGGGGRWGFRRWYRHVTAQSCETDHRPGLFRDDLQYQSVLQR